MKRKMKNKIRKYVVGLLLVCSLLTVCGNVSNEGVMPYADVIDGDSINI